MLIHEFLTRWQIIIDDKKANNLYLYCITYGSLLDYDKAGN